MGRGEQLVDDFLSAVRGFVIEETGDLIKARRQTGEVKIDPPQPGPVIGRLGRAEPRGLETMEDKIIEGRPGPVGSVHRRDVRNGERTPAPVFGTPLFEIESAGRDFTIRMRNGLIRPGSPCRDPLPEILDHFRSKFFFRRHSQVGISIADRLDEETFVRFPRDERGSRFATGEEVLKMINLKGSLHFFRVGTVTAVTFLGQDRTDLLLEELERFGRV